MAWKSWLGWTIGYAVVVWGLDVILILLEPRLSDTKQENLAQWVRFLLPLALAFAIGFRLRSWWWIAGALIATVLPVLVYPILDILQKPALERQQAGTGLILAIFATLIGGGVAAVAAVVEVACGRWCNGR